MTKKDFVLAFYPQVLRLNKFYKKKYGYSLPVYGVLAHMAVESGWATSTKMVKANALFGIKATPSWNGKVYSTATHEVYANNRVCINAQFRAYDSTYQCIKDYFELLYKNPRYSKVVGCTLGKYGQYLYDCGYMTDPTAPQTIYSIAKDLHDNYNYKELKKRG